MWLVANEGIVMEYQESFVHQQELLIIPMTNAYIFQIQIINKFEKLILPLEVRFPLNFTYLLTVVLEVSTIAGDCMKDGFVDGKGQAANFSYPSTIVHYHKENILFVIDEMNCAIRKVTPGTLGTLLMRYNNCFFQKGK